MGMKEPTLAAGPACPSASRLPMFKTNGLERKIKNKIAETQGTGINNILNS